MLKKVKNITSKLSLLCIAFLVSLLSVTVCKADSTSWNFKNSGFKDLGTISSTVTVDGLSLIGTSSKTMSIIQTSQSLNGVDYTYALSTKSSGSTSYRVVKVPVSSSSTIKVTCMSSGSSSRTLVVANASGTQLGTITAGTTISTQSYTYSGTSGYVYLYSQSGNINMFKIQVDSATTSVETSTSTSWNFKDTDFKNLGTISSTTSVNNLTLIATSSKTMSVIQDSQTLNDTTYTYALSTEGGGSTSYRSVKIPVGTSSTIKVTCMSTGSSSRTLVVANASGTTLGTITAGTSISTGTYTYSGTAGYVYLYSSGSNINIYKIQVNSTGTSSSPSEDTDSDGSASDDSSNSGSSSVDSVSTYSDLVSAITKAEKAGGGTVYVSGTTIKCTGQIALSTKNANVEIVGLKNSDGTYPVLDFSSFRSSYIGKSTSDSQVGIRISGSYYTIKNLIIQKAPDNGIQIKGTNAGNNTIESVVVRYNNDSGLQITAGAYNNKIKYVDSYRNCDVYTRASNADGFAIKLEAGTGNSFYNCRAWDNGDDGWDSYNMYNDVTYEECACWNNGNPDVATGKYDFDNGDALDTDLPLVELIIAKDSSFATNYAKGTFSLPTSSFIKTDAGTITISSWTGSNYAGNPNGFKFGSVNVTSSAVRTVKNCLAFNHENKGFDNNNCSATISLTNCISYDNGAGNYILKNSKGSMTIKALTNVYGFNGGKSDALASGSISTPSSSKQSSIRSTVDSTVTSITSAVKKNKIPGKVLFNIF